MTNGFFGNNECHDQVGDHHTEAAAQEESQDEQQTHHGGVNVQVFSQPGAYARDHAVRCAAGELFVVCVHVHLLS